MTPIPRRFWLTGAAAAVAVHAAIAAVVYWQPPESGARDAGRGGVQVSLGPAGGAPGEAVEVDGTPEAETVEPEAAEAPAVTEVEAVIPVDPDNAAVETVEPGDTATSKSVEAVEAPTEVDSAPQEAPTAAEEPQPSEAPAEPEPESAEASAPSAAGAGGQAGSGDTADAGSATSTAGGGAPEASSDYMARLRARLEKHKRYPRRARLRRQEGTAMLSVVIDREGRVVEYSIRQSSGHRILDEEVAAMIKRAQPLPAFPEDLPRARLELVVPVQFSLM